MADTALMTKLKIDSVTFMPQWRQEFSRQSGGTPRVADIGPEIWTAKIGASKLSNNTARQASALLNKLRGSLYTFYAWDPRAQYPQSDPTGSILGASTVTIYAMADSAHIRLTGLPAGYVITAGDKFSFAHGGHQCLHEFSADVMADGSGITASTEVVPNIRTGATTGLAVTLVRPYAEMMLVPGSLQFPSTGPVTSSISFDAIQIP